MTLAPIRGAPPGAPIPDFPVEKPKAKPAEPTATPASSDRSSMCATRQRHTPIEIGGNGIALTFRIIPELPAIARASLTVHVTANAVGRLGYLQMSAAKARAFLTDLRNGRSPIVATGDENGTVQIEFDITEAGCLLLIRKPGEQAILHRSIIDRSLETMAHELLADLGV